MECAAKGRSSRCAGPATRRCTRCRAVAYCTLAHQLSHMNDHKKECERLQVQMRSANLLNDFPFTFCGEATIQICKRKKTRCSFLTKRGLHQTGMWSYECSCINSDASYSLLPLIKSWNLPSMLAPCIDPEPPLAKQLTCWKEYYEWRSIPLDSPVALLLHWPLTVYHAIQLYAHRVSNAVGVEGKINIHYLGPEKELFQLATFGELLALLPRCRLNIALIGPAVPQHRDGQWINLDSFGSCDNGDCRCKSLSEIRSSELTLQLLKGFYHDRFKDIKKDSYPDIIIAPNAGIAAYPSWMETIELIHRLNVPAVFSDFCEEAAHLAVGCLSSVTGSDLKLPIQLNPFRQPLVVEDSVLHLPCYSNCFLFGI